MNLNLKRATTSTTFATLLAASSAWLTSPGPVVRLSNRQRFLHHFHHRADQFSRKQKAQLISYRCKYQYQTTKRGVIASSSSTYENQSAMNAEDGETITNNPSIAIAKGSIVNTFRGGLFAVRIDDDKITSSGTRTSTGASASASASTGTNSGEALAGDLIGRQVIFENDGQMGIVVVHRPPMVFVLKDGDDGSVDSSSAEGTVTVLNNSISIDVSQNLREADCFGRNIALSSDTNNHGDHNDATKATMKTINRPIFASIPKVNEIALINKPLITGVTMFDALTPIGKGQNMLFVGHDVSDMRRYVMDMISIQKSKEVKCVYASTGADENRKQIRGMMDSLGLDRDDIILVSSNGNSHEKENTCTNDDASYAAEGILTAATACAIGEAYAIEKGMDTLVIVDNIDLHKKFWDITTRCLVDVFGVDAVVNADRDGGASSEMRAFFSSLVQRSAQFDKERGGGSVSLLLLQTIPKIDGKNNDDIIFSPDDFKGSPRKITERIELLVKKSIPLTATNLRKIQIPVPSAEEGMRRLALQHVDDLISMSDGQIWLDERLQDSGRNPAMDFQRSITRIGIGADTESRADSSAMRRVVEGLRLDLSQAEHMDGADIETTASKKQMRNLQAWLLAMHQPSTSSPRELSESCVALLAASSGALNDSIDSGILAGSDDGAKLMRGLLTYANNSIPECLKEIDSTLDFTPKTKEIIENAIKKYMELH